VPPDVRSDPELRSAYHSLQLHWLSTVPGYRALVKERVSDARKRQRDTDERIYRGFLQRRDVDNLGRETEGCG